MNAGLSRTLRVTMAIAGFGAGAARAQDFLQTQGAFVGIPGSGQGICSGGTGG